MYNPKILLLLFGFSLLMIFAQSVSTQAGPYELLLVQDTEEIHKKAMQLLEKLENKANDKNLSIENRQRYQNRVEDLKHQLKVITRREILDNAFKEGKIDKKDLGTQEIIMAIEELSHEIKMLRKDLRIEIRSLEKRF